MFKLFTDIVCLATGSSMMCTNKFSLFYSSERESYLSYSYMRITNIIYIYIVFDF